MNIFRLYGYLFLVFLIGTQAQTFQQVANINKHESKQLNPDHLKALVDEKLKGENHKSIQLKNQVNIQYIQTFKESDSSLSSKQITPIQIIQDQNNEKTILDTLFQNFQQLLGSESYPVQLCEMENDINTYLSLSVIHKENNYILQGQLVDAQQKKVVSNILRIAESHKLIENIQCTAIPESTKIIVVWEDSHAGIIKKTLLELNPNNNQQLIVNQEYPQLGGDSLLNIQPSSLKQYNPQIEFDMEFNLIIIIWIQDEDAYMQIIDKSGINVIQSKAIVKSNVHFIKMQHNPFYLGISLIYGQKNDHGLIQLQYANVNLKKVNSSVQKWDMQEICSVDVFQYLQIQAMPEVEFHKNQVFIVFSAKEKIYGVEIEYGLCMKNIEQILVQKAGSKLVAPKIWKQTNSKGKSVLYLSYVDSLSKNLYQKDIEILEFKPNSDLNPDGDDEPDQTDSKKILILVSIGVFCLFVLVIFVSFWQKKKMEKRRQDRIMSQEINHDQLQESHIGVPFQTRLESSQIQQIQESQPPESSVNNLIGNNNQQNGILLSTNRQQQGVLDSENQFNKIGYKSEIEFKAQYDQNKAEKLSQGGFSKVFIIPSFSDQKTYIMKKFIAKTKAQSDQFSRSFYKISDLPENLQYVQKGKDYFFWEEPKQNYTNYVHIIIFEQKENSIEKEIQQRYNKNDKYTEESIIKILKQCLRGLVELEQNGIYHRNVKPSNILLEAGEVRLIDFCISQEEVLGKCMSKTLIQSQQQSQLFLSPELKIQQSMEYYDPREISPLDFMRSSIFSLGLSILAANNLLSALELTGFNSIESGEKKIQEQLQSKSLKNYKHLRMLLKQMLDFEPSKRGSLLSLYNEANHFK